jgi:hypothetical protein
MTAIEDAHEVLAIWLVVQLHKVLQHKGAATELCDLPSMIAIRQFLSKGRTHSRLHSAIPYRVEF